MILETIPERLKTIEAMLGQGGPNEYVRGCDDFCEYTRGITLTLARYPGPPPETDGIKSEINRIIGVGRKRMAEIDLPDEEVRQDAAGCLNRAEERAEEIDSIWDLEPDPKLEIETGSSPSLG